MVMLPCNVAYDPKTNRSYIYTKDLISQKNLNGELLFLDVPNEVTHFKMCSDYFPLNFFPYKLKELGSGEEDIYSLEYGEEPLATKDGRMVVLNGIYQFILRDVSPSRDKALHKLLLENFLHANKQPWYPAGACILVMVPDMIENSAPAESWYSIGSPLDPPESHSVEDIDDWIIRAVERDGYYGLEVSVENSANDQKKNHSAPLDREGLNQSIST